MGQIIAFRNAVSLANIDGASNWNTSSVTTMGYIFEGVFASVARPAWYP